jgi:sugar phosphate isomerase/epimerase
MGEHVMIIGTEAVSLADIVQTVQQEEEKFEEMTLEPFRLTKHIRKLINADFRHFELALDNRFMIPGALDDTVIEELLDLRKSRGLSYSVHLPMYDMNFMSLNEKARRATLDCLKESITATESLEITGYVLHPNRFVEYEIAMLPLAMSAKRKIFKYILGKGSGGLSELVDAAGDPRRILLEPDCAIPFDAILEPLVKEYDVGICLDYGDIVNYKINPYSFFDDHYDRIREIHFHDVALKNKIDHLPLDGGSSEWRKFIMHITRENRFDGVLLLEMMESAAIASLPRLLKAIGI